MAWALAPLLLVLDLFPLHCSLRTHSRLVLIQTSEGTHLSAISLKPPFVGVQMAQGLAKDEQEILRLLVQHVSRAFYEPRFTVVMDQLVRHPV